MRRALPGLRVWVPVAIAAAGAILYLTSHVLDERTMESLVRTRSANNIEQLARGASALITTLAVEEDPATALRVVEFMRASPLLTDAYIADERGRPLARSAADGDRVPRRTPLGGTRANVGGLVATTGPAEARTQVFPNQTVVSVAPVRWRGASGPPLYLVCEASYRGGLANARAILRFKTIVMLLTGVLLMAMLAWVLHWRVTGPARRIAHAASRLAQGDRDSRTGLRGGDELGSAGEAFDRMAEAIVRTDGELRQVRNQLDTLLRNMPVGVMAVDRKRREVLFHNPKFDELYGVELRLGQSMDDILPEVRLERPDGTPYPEDELTIRRVSRSGGPVEANDLVYVHPDGTRVPVFVRAVPVRNEGEPEFDTVLVLAQDRRELERALEERRETQRLLDTVLETLPVGVVVVSRDLRLLYANPKWLEIHGSPVTPGERVDTRLRAMHDEYSDGRPFPPEQLGLPQVLRTGRPTEVRDIVHVRPDGTRVPIVINAVPADLSGSGGFDAVVSVVQDQHELRAALEGLQDWRNRYEKVVSAMSQVVYEWDLRADTEVVSANRDVVIGQPTPGLALPIIERWALRVHPDDRERARRALEQSLADGRPYDCEYRYLHSGTRWVVVHDRGFFEPGEDGRPIRMYGTMSDVTERHTLEQQLRQAQKMETVGTLAGGVAHDFNNQLTAVLGHLDLLAADLPADDPLLEHVRVARMAAERCSQLTRGLLAFSRQIESRLRPVEADGLVEETMLLLRRVLPATVRVRTRLDSTGVRAMLDAVQIQQVLINLCVNARDAMPEGGDLTVATRRVSHADAVRGHPESRAGDFVEISVSDSGVGMPPEVQARVFEPFFTTKAVGEGTGLGLAMVYGIVRKHLGWIELESALGVGSTFRILLPLSESRAVAPDATGTAPASGRAGRGRSVLVVDDEPGIREVAALALEQRGWRVYAAADGSEALRVLRAAPDDVAVVVLDLVMPGLAAGTVLRRIRAIAPHVRVVLSSGYASRGADVGMEVDAYLPKPYTGSALASTVAELLDGPVAAGAPA